MRHQHDLSKKLRVVIDTELLVAAMIARVWPEHATRHEVNSFHLLRLATKEGQLCFSNDTLNDFTQRASSAYSDDKFRQPKNDKRVKFTETYIDPFVHMVTPGASVHPETVGRRSKKLMDVADGGSAHYLVSSVKVLQALESEGLCEFIAPSVFMQAMTKRISLRQNMSRPTNPGKPRQPLVISDKPVLVYVPAAQPAPKLAVMPPARKFVEVAKPVVVPIAKPVAINRDTRAIVLDTNVLIDAMLAYTADKRKVSADKLVALTMVEHADREYRMCFTPATWKEFHHMSRKVMQRERGPEAAPLHAEFVKWVDQHKYMVEPVACSLKCKDRNDQMLLEAANGAGARHVVSSDRDLLIMRFNTLTQGFDCITPQQFLMKIETKVHQQMQKRERKPVSARGCRHG